jgi:predicted outer membrane repeat protein
MLFVCVVLLFALGAHAQLIVVTTTLPTPLAANANYLLSATISLSGAGDYVGKGNTTITCNVLPCFNVSLATSGKVLFANVTFDVPPGLAHMFRVHSVGHLELSDLTFRAAQTNSTELVRWQAAGGNLTIRGLGSAAAPVDFGSLLGAVAPAQVDALVFKDSHGSCRANCFTITTIDGRVPQPSITFDNVHWRQNGSGQLIRPAGLIASLSLTQSTFFATVSVESGIVRNITMRHCTMYGGLRVQTAAFAHVSDVRFLLDDFVGGQTFSALRAAATVGMTLLMENVVATAKRTPGPHHFHVLDLVGDDGSTVVVRNVSVVGFRGLVHSYEAETPLQQITIDGVRTSDANFLLYAGPEMGARIVRIANVDASISAEPFIDVVSLKSFDDVRVTNMSVTGSVGRDIFHIENGAPNASFVVQDIRISETTFRIGVFGRQVANAKARGFEFADVHVRDSLANNSIIDVFTSASSSLTNLSLVNTTVALVAVTGDFPAITGVTVQRSSLKGWNGLVDSSIAERPSVAWTGFNLEDSTFPTYFAVLRCQEINVAFSDWSVRDLADTDPLNLLYAVNRISEISIDRFFVAGFEGGLWDDIESHKFVLQNSVFERSGHLIWDNPAAARVAVVQNVTVTNGSCGAKEKAFVFSDANVTVSDLRVSGGTCMALDATRCNLTLVDSLFERINASSAMLVQSSNATITGTVVRSMRGLSSAFVSQSNAAILLREVLFENNLATQSRGGAIQSDGELLRIVDSQFFDNRAAPDGGAIAANALEVDRSLFRRNAATVDGGAISCASAQITECDFEANVAPSGSALSVRAPPSVVSVAKSAFFANAGNSTVQLATGNFAVSVVESCLCNNTAKAASIDCRDASGSLVANASTFADNAQRCTADAFQPSVCPTVGCQRRVPLLQFPRTTTRMASTTALGATPMASTSMTMTNNSSALESVPLSEPEPDDGLDAGTLGAIIGGSAAGLLIIIGVAAFFVMRKRKTGAGKQSAASAPAASGSSSSSAYGSVANAVPLNAMGAADYDLGGIPVIPAKPNVYVAAPATDEVAHLD